MRQGMRETGGGECQRGQCGQCLRTLPAMRETGGGQCLRMSGGGECPETARAGGQCLPMLPPHAASHLYSAHLHLPISVRPQAHGSGGWWQMRIRRHEQVAE